MAKSLHGSETNGDEAPKNKKMHDASSRIVEHLFLNKTAKRVFETFERLTSSVLLGADAYRL